jgi:hypothetical protein
MQICESEDGPRCFGIGACFRCMCPLAPPTCQLANVRASAREPANLLTRWLADLLPAPSLLLAPPAPLTPPTPLFFVPHVTGRSYSACDSIRVLTKRLAEIPSLFRSAPPETSIWKRKTADREPDPGNSAFRTPPAAPPPNLCSAPFHPQSSAEIPQSYLTHQGEPHENLPGK